jgi:two-component sensor histidine kinase
LDLCVYVLASTVIVLAVGRYRELTELVRIREAALEIELAEKALREDALQRANERNEVLLREIHHRVKNNLQIIVGLLSSHSRRVRNPEIRDLLCQFQGRVLAIARLYDRIQQVETFETVEFSALLRAICADIMQSANAEGAIDFRSDRPAVVATTPAINLAIITNELITNALKHANLGDKGAVEVRCEEDDAQISIVVADNGPGLAPDFDSAPSSGFGMNMARRIIEGMGGALLVLPRTRGAAFEVKVPRNKAIGLGS